MQPEFTMYHIQYKTESGDAVRWHEAYRTETEAHRKVKLLSWAPYEQPRVIGCSQPSPCNPYHCIHGFVRF